MSAHKNISVVIPALNEEQAIALVVADLRLLKDATGQFLIDEIVVCDNGSSDNTAELARKAGARVVVEPRPGYGRACMCGLASLQNPDIILFVDGDNAFYARQATELVDALAQGADMVVGSREKGRIAPGAMTILQRRGNRLACRLIFWLWRTRVSDLGPFRAIKWSALKKMSMAEQTYGWTVEMQIKAIILGLHSVEIPVDTKKRLGKSKISGTFTGTLSAGLGILWTITKLSLKKNLFNPA